MVTPPTFAKLYLHDDLETTNLRVRWDRREETEFLPLFPLIFTERELERWRLDYILNPELLPFFRAEFIAIEWPYAQNKRTQRAGGKHKV